MNKTVAVRSSYIIVNATLIAAPPSTKNRTGERDPEMHSAKKGNRGTSA